MTSQQIINDLATKLLDSALFTASDKVSGSLYRGDGQTSSRPRDSRREDVVIIWTTGTEGQVAQGIITVQIYVPDVTPWRNGVYVEASARLAAIEALAANALKTLAKNPVHYYLDEAIHTVADTSINQHIVVLRLNYNYINLD